MKGSGLYGFNSHFTPMYLATQGDLSQISPTIPNPYRTSIELILFELPYKDGPRTVMGVKTR